METSPPTSNRNNGHDKQACVLSGNTSFGRLLKVVLGGIEGYVFETLTEEPLLEEVRRRRPDVFILMEASDFYRRLRSDPDFDDLPVMYVAVSETDADKLPEMFASDPVWILKNDPKQLAKILGDLQAQRKVKRILCVDDSPTLLKQVRKAFAGTPYAVFTAENGVQGMNLLGEVNPDLLLVDVEMPVMDGLTLCREVRRREDFGDIPLIILSSRMDHETIAAGFEAGADEYMTKPFYPDELLNKVEAYLAPPPTRRQEHILAVIQNANVTHQLRMHLVKQGFAVTAAGDVRSALRMALFDPPDLIVSDAEVEGVTGFQFCAEVRKTPALRRLPFVMVTDKTSVGARRMGERVGVSAYLTKPFTGESLIVLVERLLAEHRSLMALEWDMVLASITSLARALDERDPYTRFHSENVARFAVAVGRKAGLDSLQLENLRLAGLLHDIGKIGIPDKVLHKPGRLTDEEFEKIKQHSRLGAEILQPIPSLEQVVPAILHHHERIDGRGYPSGLSGDQIPVFAQILAVADMYDALVTDRPYRNGMPQDRALDIMREASGTQVSSKYVKILINWLSESKDETGVS